MKNPKQNRIELSSLKSFNRKFFDGEEDFTYVGDGSLGGKAQGLAFATHLLKNNISENEFPGVVINIPKMVVLTTSCFDNFMRLNKLYDIAYSNEPDNIIAYKFQEGSLPVDLIGDLRALIAKVNTPLAVRSSSLLEDAMYEPFAGIYGTKMIPNNQPDTTTRFRKLTEAIKFVYASTFFKEAKDYIKATKNRIKDEKMAVIIQEIVGFRYDDRFYPTISGVARSYNFYPMGFAKPEEGVVDLALGLGKTIVDGGVSWTFSPSRPKSKPPFANVKDMIELTQNKYWVVNMGKPPAYDPIKETEYMFEADLTDAEYDGTLKFIASTYDAASDRVKPGIGYPGPRIINFSQILEFNIFPLNKIVKKVLDTCEEAVGTAVEIEFAITLDKNDCKPVRFGFLQVRPMVVSDEKVEIEQEDLSPEKIFLSSKYVLGNGTVDTITDIVYVKPEVFEAKYSPEIAIEIEKINKSLIDNNKKYLLIGFGRWGSSDPWLGIPVNWGQISGARVIVESMFSGMNVELSQGSHFFHNITSFRVLYFSVPAGEQNNIDWNWLKTNNTVRQTELKFIKHIELNKPLSVKVDGRKGLGVIFK